MTKAEDLKLKLTEANKAYRSGESKIDDQTFDDLLDEYRSIVSEEEYNAFRNSLNEGMVETQREKIKHKFIAGSLDKLKAEEPEEVEKYVLKHIKNKLCLSAKIDGLSGIAKYENGKLVGFSTRGDGFTGISVFNKAKYLKFLPKEIDLKDEETYIRGELVILTEDYDKIEGTSARNVVAGIINRLEFNPKDVEAVSFIAYTIMGPKYSKTEQFEILERNNFKTAWHSLENPYKLMKEGICEHLTEIANRDFGMKTDGLVLCDSEYHNEEKYRPEGSVAYKINQQVFTTTLKGIEWQGPSKDGKMVPVANVTPTECGGVVVSKITLNNLDFIESLGLEMGDVLRARRSGDVIPQLLNIESHTTESTKIQYPEECPCCHSKLVREGPFLYCKNENCPDKTTSQIELFIKNLEIENASFKTLKNFGITDLKSLLNFKARPDHKSETNLLGEMKAKMFSKTEKDLFYAMPMKDFAKKTLKTIVNFYGWSSIVTGEIENASKKSLPEGIGDITMTKFLEGYRKLLKNVNMIISDPRYNKQETINEKMKEDKNGMSVCFTGKLNTMGRNEASKMAEEKGFDVKNSVTRGLTYLVTNDVNSGSSKNRKAKDFGTKIITEEEFLEMMKD